MLSSAELYSIPFVEINTKNMMDISHHSSPILCEPVLIFSQMLWILSIRLIERETDMRIYCSQWQLDDELYNSREEKLIEPWDTAS